MEQKRERSKSKDKNKVSIKNIPKTWKWFDVKKMVEDKLGTSAFVNYDGMSGTGVISFRNELQARLAIEKLHK